MGLAGDAEQLFTAECRSAAEAAQLVTRLNRWSELAGLQPFDLGPLKPGIVYTLKGPQGPGRVRLDNRDDVYFDPAAVDGVTLKQGSRVLVGEVRTDGALDVDFMFGSRLQAGRVSAFPTAQPTKAAALAPEAREKLMGVAGPALGGWNAARKVRTERPRKVALAMGDLVYGFGAGIHLYLGVAPSQRRGADELPLVSYLPLLSSKLTLVATGDDSCMWGMCEAIPARLREGLEKAFGL